MFGPTTFIIQQNPLGQDFRNSFLKDIQSSSLNKLFFNNVEVRALGAQSVTVLLCIFLSNAFIALGLSFG